MTDGDYREAEQYVYVPARGFGKSDRKMPTCAWVKGDDAPGSDNPAECRSLENPHTLSYDETDPDEPYIIVGTVEGHMLDIDVDVGDDHDETFGGDVEDIRTPKGVFAFLSPSGGPHSVLKFEREHDFSSVSGVDLQGDIPGSMGVIASPFHHPDYEITNEPDERVCFDDVVESDDDACLNNGFDAELLTDGGDEAESSDTRSSFESGGYSGNGLTPEQAADALDYIDPDAEYDTWFEIGVALEDEYPDTRALSLFKNWSRGGSKWDSKAEQQAERIISDATPGSGRTMGTVTRLAQQNGWEHPGGGRSSASEPVDKSGETASTDGGTTTASTDESDNGETGGGLPEPEYPLVRYNGGYAIHHPSDEGDSDGWYEQLTNFQIEAKTFLLDPDENDERADLTIHQSGGNGSYDVTVPFTDFNDIRSFKNSVVVRRTTRFDGDTGELNDIREFVGKQDAPERIGMKQIGLFGDEYGELVTPTGTLGACGWLEDPEHAYVKQSIGLEPKWSLADEDGAEFENADVAEVLERIPETRETDRLLPAVGWFYASGLRPLIHEWSGEFNILNVTGGTEAGKSSTLGTLWSLFGMDDDPLQVSEESKFAMTRSMAATNSVPVWFDEYKPATTDSWRIDSFHGLLRAVTRGGTVQRGNADKSVDSYSLSAPVAVSGEQRIQGSAEQRRCIMTTFTKDARREGTDTARAYKELTGESYLNDDGETVTPERMAFRGHALAYYRFIAGLDSDRAREQWETAREDVTDMLDGLDESDGLGTAARQGLQTVVFGLRLYREFGETVGADVDDLVNEDSIESAVRFSATEFVSGGHKSHVDTLVELVAAAARAEYIEEGEHYSIVKDGTPNAEIRVNMTAAFDQITRYVRDFNVSADLLDSYGDYRDRLKEAYENNGGYVISYRQNTREIGRAIGIHARRATDSLDGFEARALNCETIEDKDSYGSDHGGEIAQGERLTFITDVIDDLCERDDGAEHAQTGDIVNAAMDAGIDKSAANSALDKLSRQGEIYQPLTGQYRTK